MSGNPLSSNGEGFEYPKGSGGHIMYEQGFVWAGYNALCNDSSGTPNPVTLKLSGSTYSYGLQAGPILVPGTATRRPVAADPADPKYRVFRTRTDIHPGMAKIDALNIITSTELPYTGRYENSTADQIYQQYMDDWNGWPASDGAPFTDVDGNGVYDPAIDIPGEPGADMTLWYVANDMDTRRQACATPSPDAMGVEQQRTIWAYRGSSNPSLASAIFTRCRLINKSGSRIDSMFIGEWSDPDIGGILGSTSNLSGCDIRRDLGFTYSGVVCSPEPAYGCTPPAGGVVILQGPVVPGASLDSAIFGGSRRSGYRNLPMTSFAYFTCCCDYSSPSVPIEFYRCMNGVDPFTGSPRIDPTTYLPSKFVGSGDPVEGTGWLDGAYTSCGERQMMLSSGPFTLAPGDTQEMVIATLVGRGTDRLSSISDFRHSADVIRSLYVHFMNATLLPPPPLLQAAGLDGEVVLSWGDPGNH